jgi:beta-glucosidase-like glycosyl hydrolase
MCGISLLFLSLLSLYCVEVAAYPNGYVWGCLNISASYPFCNWSLPIEKRIEDLISRLTLTEKLNLMGANTVTTGVGSCTCMDSGVLRLGIPTYLHLVETNSAVASQCVSPSVCATEFPAPACLAASFNRTVWAIKGKIISDEMRAFNNINWMRGTDNGNAYIGLTGFGPNINIVRDPRFGRNSELPSEDPFLAGLFLSFYFF